jgi:acyl carrier protein
LTPETNTEIRRVIAEHARLPIDIATLSDHDDLFSAGMTSHASVNVMLALEDAFDLEFTDAMLTRAVFESVDSIGAAIDALSAAAS